MLCRLMNENYLCTRVYSPTYVNNLLAELI